MRALIQTSCIAAACFGVLLSRPSLGQSVPPQVAETGQVSGRVTSADGGVPIRGVAVSVASPMGVRISETDDHGTYEFAGLRPGMYSLSFTKTGYVRATGSPLTVEIASGQVRRDVDVMLEQWGVIAVHVSDERGSALARVHVDALTVNGTGATRTMTRAVVAAASVPNFFRRKEFLTDDRGDVRIYGLRAGVYTLVIDPWRNPLVDPSHGDHNLIYPPTYYPGTPSTAEAQTLSLGPGDEISTRVSVAPARAAHISGRVMRWNGTRGRAFVILRLNPAGPLYQDDLISDVLQRADLVNGRFTFWNIRPGEYIIQTSYDDDSPELDGDGSVAVTVSGKDVADLLINTRPAEKRLPKKGRISL